MADSRLTPQVVRFWAVMDSSVALLLALPWVQARFVALVYRINDWLGGIGTAPSFEGIQWFFVSLAGVLVCVWVMARLLQPTRVLGLVDGFGRVVVTVLIVYFVCFAGAPRVLLFFVLSEGAGAIHQLDCGLVRHHNTPCPE